MRTPLSRRAVLRGLGTAVALPLLESLAPAAPKPYAKRMAFVYVPNGINMEKWTPAATGADYVLSPTLEPLAAHQKDLLVVGGLAQKNAFGNGDGGGDHARASATYLTGVHPKKSASDVRTGISVDQFAANRIGDKTRLPSLELSCDRGQEAGSCDSGYSCAYQFNISWRSESEPMNPEIEPKLVFERLFGAGTEGESNEARRRRSQSDLSVLDFVMDQAKSIQSSIGLADKRKLDEYFTAVRDVERRISMNGAMPVAVPEGAVGDFNAEYSFERHVRLMFDLMTLAFQTDTTRVATFLIAHDGGNRPYPFAGVPQGHHHISHHRNQADALAKLAIIDRWHVSQFAYFLEKLKSVQEGEGRLLDNCMIVYGAGISDGNEHSHDNLPTILAGRAGGSISPGRHIRAEGAPMTNLFLSMLDRMGAPAERFGDSTGRFEAIA
jgi:Protein of unknown function (DUF1552)